MTWIQFLKIRSLVTGRKIACLSQKMWHMVVQSPHGFQAPSVKQKWEEHLPTIPWGEDCAAWQKETARHCVTKLSFPTLQSTCWGGTIELPNSSPFELKCLISGELPIILSGAGQWRSLQKQPLHLIKYMWFQSIHRSKRNYTGNFAVSALKKKKSHFPMK